MSRITYNGKEYEILDEETKQQVFYTYSKAKCVSTGEIVLIQTLDKYLLKNELSKFPINDLDKTYKHYLKSYEKDIKYSRKYASPNLVKCVDFINEESDIIIIKEYCDISLKDYLAKEAKNGLKPREIRKIFNQLNII